MIQIITPGTRKQKQCEFCGCVFSYDSEDVDRNQPYGLYINCPQCKKTICLSQTRQAFIPDGKVTDEAREPVNRKYISGDFTTYGFCPGCGAEVEDSIGGKDEVCPKCGQKLNWR